MQGFRRKFKRLLVKFDSIAGIRLVNLNFNDFIWQQFSTKFLKWSISNRICCSKHDTNKKTERFLVKVNNVDWFDEKVLFSIKFSLASLKTLFNLDD